MPSRRSAWASNITPPSELIRPPSKAAVIFLRQTAGKQNGRRLSSVMAGVARVIPAKGWLQRIHEGGGLGWRKLENRVTRPRDCQEFRARLSGLTDQSMAAVKRSPKR